MYPFPDGAIFVRNAWYMAAWSSEVTGDAPLARTLLEEPIVLFRDAAGEAKGLSGLCAHRLFPLGEAMVKDGVIQCPYHGFRFAADGRCVHVPAQKAVPKGEQLRPYPVIERWGIVWLWPGDPVLADPDSLPPLDAYGAGRAGWLLTPNGHSHIRARAQLIIDNLMDLSHVAYLHARTLSFTGVQEIAATYNAEMPFTARRLARAQSPDDAYQRHAFPDNALPVDIEITSTFLSPAIILSTQRFHVSDEAGTPAYLGTLHHIHAPTPETRHTCLDFSGHLRDCNHPSTALDRFLSKVIHAAREEDIFALERIESVVDRFGDPRRELSGAGDRSVLLARRYMEKLMRGENHG